MDRDEIAAKRNLSAYANGGQVDDADAPALPGIVGREDNLGADPGRNPALILRSRLARCLAVKLRGPISRAWGPTKLPTG
jgi:hypothetical protein